MEAELEVLRPGPFSSIQDTGRNGYMEFGVPMGGAMDRYAHKLANIYLRNPVHAAVMEITMAGPVLRFSHPTEIVLTGADLTPQLNESPIVNSQPYQIQEGDVLSFGKRKKGCRTYLGIAGGFRTEEVLGSRSWCKGITEEFRLMKGMSIPYLGRRDAQEETFTTVKEEEYLDTASIGVVPGPEFQLLSAQQQEELTGKNFQVGRNNSRMGIQLEGELSNELEPIITGPVLPGTVQLTPSGTLIVLMRDCQTTGGYPRVLQLTEKGINALAQKLTGEGIIFRMS